MSLLELEFAPDAVERERATATRFVDTPHHPCAACRAEARQGARTPDQVRAGTLWRAAEEPGGFGVRVCEEHV